MTDKMLADSSYREKTYAKALEKVITRKLHACEFPGDAEIFLSRMLGRYGQPGLEKIFPSEIVGWIKYLLSHRQILYYYRKRHPRDEAGL